MLPFSSHMYVKTKTLRPRHLFLSLEIWFIIDQITPCLHWNPIFIYFYHQWPVITFVRGTSNFQSHDWSPIRIAATKQFPFVQLFSTMETFFLFRNWTSRKKENVDFRQKLISSEEIQIKYIVQVCHVPQRHPLSREPYPRGQMCLCNIQKYMRPLDAYFLCYTMRAWSIYCFLVIVYIWAIWLLHSLSCNRIQGNEKIIKCGKRECMVF